MAIISLAKARELLNISSTEQNDWITALIPEIEDDYVHIRGKPFDIATKLTIESTGLPADEKMEIEIGNSAAVGGTASGREYDIRLRTSDTASMIAYRIINQIQPSAYFNLTLSDASTSSANVYISENVPSWQEFISMLDITVTASTSIDTTIEKMQTVYPAGSELTAAQMIQYQMSKPGGVQAESLGDYSVTYSEARGGYPKSIMGQIKRYAVTL